MSYGIRLGQTPLGRLAGYWKHVLGGALLYTGSYLSSELFDGHLETNEMKSSSNLRV